jgi:hypothetical protein
VILKVAPRMRSVPAPARRAADVAALATSVMQQFPRLDVVETTPRLNIRKTILDDTEADLDRIIAGELLEN